MRRTDLSPVWKALASPLRRRLLDLLRERPRTTGELCDAFPRLSRFAVLQHLLVLKGADLVLAKAEGRVRRNYLNAVPIREIYERWIRPYEGSWARSLLRLRDRAEADEPAAAPPVAPARRARSRAHPDVVRESPPGGTKP